MRTTKKPYERGADVSREIPDGVLLLYGKEIDIKNSEILYQQDDYTQEIFERDFDVKSGTWYVEDGWVVGKNPDCCPGMLVSKADFFGDVLLEVTCKMVEPSTHDINVMINGSWDDEKNKRSWAYVTGLEAFWHGNIGFEKSPKYDLTIANGMLDFDPTKESRLQFGRVDNTLFVLVDGKLAFQISDPDPIDGNLYGKIGFEAFASWWKFRDVCVKKLSYIDVKEAYVSEF